MLRDCCNAWFDLSMKQRIIDAGFAFFGATGLHARVAPWTRGRGAILTLHHVRPWVPRPFAPNRSLEIEPAFLDAALGRIRALGYDFVTVDEALRRLLLPQSRPFVTLTLDDGYRDLCEHALPILERHEAPFVAYLATGFVERTARLWWIELEEAVRRLDRIEADGAGERMVLVAATPEQKSAAFRTLYQRLRMGPEAELRAVISHLAAAAGIDAAAIPAALCLDRDEIRALARHPLCTIGAHTVTHPMLAKHPEAIARAEMVDGRRQLEEAIGLPVRHFAYPVGHPTTAGPREFALAAELGLASGVTTRPGVLFSEDAARATSLPRVSLNGHWQSLTAVEVLLSGAPFAVWNRVGAIRPRRPTAQAPSRDRGPASSGSTA